MRRLNTCWPHARCCRVKRGPTGISVQLARFQQGPSRRVKCKGRATSGLLDPRATVCRNQTEGLQWHQTTMPSTSTVYKTTLSSESRLFSQLCFLQCCLPSPTGIPFNILFAPHSGQILVTQYLKRIVFKKPWLLWLIGLSAGVWTKGSPVRYPPLGGYSRGNHTLMFLSLSFSLPSPLKIINIIF